MEEDSTQVDSTQVDSTQVDSYLFLRDAFASCGDSLVCSKLFALGSASNWSSLISWDTNHLQFHQLLLPDSVAFSVSYSSSEDLPLGYMTVVGERIGELDSLTRSPVEIATLCFTPFFTTSSRTEIKVENDSIGLDSLDLPDNLKGEITLILCDSIELGGGNCDPIDGVGLTTSTVTETTAYIHNSHHNQEWKNQFRYRKKNTLNWVYTNIGTSYFRRLVALQSGTTYEFQVNQECEDGSFSDYSFSYYFTTHGESADGSVEEEEEGEIMIDATCERIDSTQLSVSTIKQYFAYVYTPQPLGPVNNQFRYRPVGTSFWFYTSISPTYYRWLRGLKDGTLYEYQVSHECAPGNWSPYSGSYEFTTLVSIN